MEKIAVVIAVEARASSTDCDWTELPAVILVRIFGTLQITDLFSSGGVCCSWRRSHLEARRFRRCSPHQGPCLVYSAADRDDSTATLHHLTTDKLCHVTIPGTRALPFAPAMSWARPTAGSSQQTTAPISSLSTP